MPSERVQRRIDRLLDDAEEAADRHDWEAVAEYVRAVLSADPDNDDALTFQSMASAARGADKDNAAPEEPVGADRDPPSGGPVPTPTQSVQTDSTLPASFAGGRYQIERYLGEGGKKRVYAARDTLLDREVAFALIKTEGLDQSSKDRISREAQAMGRLGVHPNIVAVLDLGQEDDGSPYIVTELMTGGDVEGLLSSQPTSQPPPSRGGGDEMPSPWEGEGLGVGRSSDLQERPSRSSGQSPVPLERVIEIGKAVCEGLEFAHSRGIVHRDLKPGNVWLSDDPTSGSGQLQSVKIGDFGLAMIADRSRLTREATMIGTPYYMPPEQATGGDTTQRSDLYSLGAMLYEMVTGRPPFLGDEEIAIISQHINTAPVAPTWHNGEVPRPLEALILRLLAKDPSERPESARDVLNALDAIDLTARGEIVEHDSSSLESLAGGVFVGRQAEMDQLKSALEDTLGGSGRLVTLVGEPGIGKTRTSEELVTYAGLRGARVLWGRCYETGGQPPYWPWVQAIRSHAREADPDELRRQMGASASVISEIVPDVKERLPEIQPPIPLDDPDSARFRLFDSITSFLRTASRSEPFVIVLDDLHWSDRPSLTFLEFMAREISQSRIMLLCTYRDMELNRRHPLSVTLGDLARERLYERVLLRGLTESDIARFVEIAAGVQPPAELSVTVHRHTEGNPLFVTEVIRDLVQSGELAENRTSGASTWSVRIPEGVREVIGRRLDRLSERANDMLTTAAVVGRDFTLNVISALTEDTTEGQLLDALDEALDARIIEELHDAVGHYQFTHALMQETLTGELSLTRRVRLHARIAETLEQLYGEDVDEHAAILAHHFGEAEAVKGVEPVIKYSLIAANSYLDALAHEEAATLLQRVVELRDGDEMDLELARTKSALAKALGALNEHVQAKEAIIESYDYFMADGHLPDAVDLMTHPFQAPVYFLIGVEPFTPLIDAIDPNSEAFIKLTVLQAVVDPGEDQVYSRSISRLKSLLPVAENIGNARLQNMIIAALATIFGFAGRTKESQKFADDALAAPIELTTPGDRLRAWNWRNLGFVSQGDAAAARQANKEFAEEAISFHERGWLNVAAHNDISLLMELGEWEEVVERGRDALDASPGDVRLLTRVAIALYNLGHFDDARAVASQVLDIGYHSDQRWDNLGYCMVLDMARRNAGPGELATGINQLLQQGRSYLTGGHVQLMLSRPMLLSIANEVLTPDEMAQFYAPFLDPDSLLENSTSSFRAVPINIDQARIRLQLNDISGAISEFETGIEWCRDHGYKGSLVWACVDLAELLEERDQFGDRKRAAGLKDEALGLARELNMRPLTERLLAGRDIVST